MCLCSFTFSLQLRPQTTTTFIPAAAPDAQTPGLTRDRAEPDRAQLNRNKRILTGTGRTEPERAEPSRTRLNRTAHSSSEADVLVLILIRSCRTIPVEDVRVKVLQEDPGSLMEVSV